MKDKVLELLKLGKIPNNADMSDEVFKKYDELVQMDECLTFEEAEALISLFSDDCDDLNWGLLHAIESVYIQDDPDIGRYSELISKCNNPEFKELLVTRLNNGLEKADGERSI